MVPPVSARWFSKPRPESKGKQIISLKPYLPCRRDSNVSQATPEARTEGRDIYGFAQGKEADRYIGFVYGKRTLLIMA